MSSECYGCDGTGKRTFDCRSCDGSGTFEGTCRNCNGTGLFTRPAKECFACQGTGCHHGYACRKCNGTGEFKPAISQECHRCNGTGTFTAPCRKCQGTGDFTVSCRRCGGTGVYQGKHPCHSDSSSDELIGRVAFWAVRQMVLPDFGLLDAIGLFSDFLSE
jgi:DnaJ-class molecular chaperone